MRPGIFVVAQLATGGQTGRPCRTRERLRQERTVADLISGSEASVLRRRDPGLDRGTVAQRPFN